MHNRLRILLRMIHPTKSEAGKLGGEAGKGSEAKALSARNAAKARWDRHRSASHATNPASHTHVSASHGTPISASHDPISASHTQNCASHTPNTSASHDLDTDAKQNVPMPETDLSVYLSSSDRAPSQFKKTLPDRPNVNLDVYLTDPVLHD